MTPEERFTKIENLLLSLTENQVQIHADIQKHDGAIRDLIVVNRSLVDSQQLLTTQIGQITVRINEITNQISEITRQIGQLDDKLTTGMEKLQDAQRTTEEKLNMLIETVDRIIRNREN